MESVPRNVGPEADIDVWCLLEDKDVGESAR